LAKEGLMIFEPEIKYMPLFFHWNGAWYDFEVAGGPFDARPVAGTFNVCVRAEHVPEHGVHAWLPILDFMVPSDKVMVKRVMRETLRAMLEGKQVFIGCMGGIGRTGLLMALLVKMAGHPKPVQYVRAHYDSHAVETEKQVRFIREFDVSEVQKWFFWNSWRHRLFGWCL
jgi:hypothetical protein